MNNFNLRYEYLDGCNDYHDQLQKELGVEISEDDDGHNEIVQSQELQKYDEKDTNLEEDKITLSNIIGLKEKNRQKLLNIMSEIIQCLQWDNPNISDTRKLTPFPKIPIFQPASG